MDPLSRYVYFCCIVNVSRGKHFNVASRVHGPQRSVDSMTVMQLWEVKNETHNRALHSQLISSLFEKAPTLSVQVGERGQVRPGQARSTSFAGVAGQQWIMIRDTTGSRLFATIALGNAFLLQTS